MNWIDQEKEHLLSDLMDLIRIPSVSKEDADDGYPFGKPCADVLEKVLKIGSRLGFDGCNHENYCASILWKGQRSEEIGIFTHLDVVPEGNGWRYSPYEPVLKDGLVIGRGSSDNKGPAVAVLYALKYLKNSGYQPNHSIRMFFGANEECGMKDIEYYLQHFPMPVFSFTPDAAFPVCHGEKGVMELQVSCQMDSDIMMEFQAGVASNAVPSEACAMLKISYEDARCCLSSYDCRVESVGEGIKVYANGIAAHAAFPEGSDSAEVKLADILLNSGLLDENAEQIMRDVALFFSDYYGAGMGIPYVDEISGKLTHVGGMAKTVNGRFLQNINIRYPVTTDRGKMLLEIQKCMSDKGLEIDFIRDSMPCFVDASSTEVQILTEISNRHLGMNAVPYVMGGGTYARKLKRAIGFGPGIPGEVSVFGADRGKGHQPDEYTRIDKLLQSVAIYMEAIQKLDKVIG